MKGRGRLALLVEPWRFGPLDPLVTSLDLPPAEMPPPAPVAAPLDNSRKLGGLVEKSLTALEDILDIDLPDHRTRAIEDVATVARLHLSATEKVLNTQLRADENVLKRKSVNAHGELLKQLREAEGRLPIRVIEGEVSMAAE